MSKISKIVGGTLGPGGHPVLIERPEPDLPPIVTKDGVTVYRALGFEDSVEQNILEASRDASVRTAQEAGDGTTTATILAEAFVRCTHEFCENNPSIPPIQVIKIIQDVYKNKLEPLINKNAIKCSLDKKGSKVLHSVAKLSANGDAALADAVMECFKICGDEGNVTIIDSSGPSGYEVEKLEGFPVSMGYEESCAKYFPMFINDQGTQRIVAEKPMFLLYFGRITDIQTLIPIISKLTEGWANDNPWIVPHNLVVVAVGFSETVLGQMAFWTANPTQLNVYPLVVPQSMLMNGQRCFLDDLAAVTGATVYDQLTTPIETCELNPEIGKTGIGNLELNENSVWVTRGVRSFECSRYRSTIVGWCSEDAVIARQEEVMEQAKSSESKLEKDLILERAAKLTGSIAKLKVIGSSNGELKERRDRAEDAVCAVRGALKDGALIGGGWMLAKLIDSLDSKSAVESLIIAPALWEPIVTLYSNAGLDLGEMKNDFDFSKNLKQSEVIVRDISSNTMVKALEAGILDSLPAVKEALKNAISIATLLGTLGGCVVSPRDKEVDKMETKDYNEFVRNANFNPADERAM
jgi:chaperonin GroEL